jgi:hypothetical protein
MLGDNDRDICRHTGLEFQIRIVHPDHRVVGDNVLNRERRIAHLNHGAMEGAIRECVNCKIDVLMFLDATDVGFGYIGVDLHFGEIIGDNEEDRRVEARRDGLSHVHAARNDHAIHGRINRAVRQIHLGLLNRSLLDLDGRLGLMEVGHRLVVVGMRDEFAFVQFLGAHGVDFRQFQGRLRVGEVPLGLVQVGDICRRVDLRDQLAIRHRRIVVHVKFGNPSRNLAADLDIGNGIELARRGDKLRQITACNRRRLVLRDAVAPQFGVPKACCRQNDHTAKNNHPFPRPLFRCFCHRQFQNPSVSCPSLF